MDIADAIMQRAESLLLVDPAAAGAAYLEAREVFLATQRPVEAAECALALAQLAQEDFDLESAHRLALLAADGFASRPELQQRAYMLAGYVALAADATTSARNCFLAAATGDYAWQALEALADLNLEAGDATGAEECLHEAWARLPVDAPPVVVARLRERFGLLAYEDGRVTEALAALECAVSSLSRCTAADSQLMRARLGTDLADLYQTVGRTRDALAHYRSVQAYYHAAGLERRAERIAERIAHLPYEATG